MFSREPFFWNDQKVLPRDRVTIVTPHGARITGKVVMTFTTHVVLNTGGRYGSPKVGNNDNIISVRAGKR